MTASNPPSRPVSNARPADEWAKKVGSHRRRQASVAAILDETFGRLARCRPELWGRRAFLMLVGLAYERLVAHEEHITTDELIALAKVLTEQRRAEARGVNRPQADETLDTAPAAANAELPNQFADVVRQIYGTSFHAAP